MKKLNCPTDNLINSFLENCFFSENASSNAIFIYIVENGLLTLPPMLEKNDCINIGEDFIYISTDETIIEINIEKIKPIF